MSRDKLPELIEDIVYGEKFHLLDNAKGQAALNVVRAGAPVDTLVRDLIQGPVRQHRIAQAFLGPFPVPKLNDGDFIQGFNIKGQPIIIPLQYRNAHSLKVVRTGGGKTQMAFFHYLQIAPHVKGTLIIECRKREFPKIKQLLSRVNVDLIILPGRMLRFNPLEVPIEVHPSDWIPRVSEMIIQVLDLPPRTSTLCQTLLHRLFKRVGVFDGGTLCPTMYDLLHEAKEDREANPIARNTLIDKLGPLLDSLGPEVLAYRRGWPVHKLAKMHINLLLDGIADVGQNLIINALLLSEFTSRVAQGISNVKMDLDIIVDEGQRIVSTKSGSRAALIGLWPLIRGTGISLDISVPTCQGLIPEALSFTANKYLGICGSASDYELIGRSMRLSKEQLDWTFHNTRPGRMIAQLGEGNFRMPYVLDIPLLNIPRNNDDHTNAHDVGPLKALPVVRQ